MEKIEIEIIGVPAFTAVGLVHRVIAGGRDATGAYPATSAFGKPGGKAIEVFCGKTEQGDRFLVRMEP